MLLDFRPKLPPHAALFSATSPPKPSSKAPGSCSPTDDSSSPGAEHEKPQRSASMNSTSDSNDVGNDDKHEEDDDDEGPSTLVYKKDRDDCSRDIEMDIVKKKESGASADEMNLSSLDSSSVQEDNSSANSSESCNDHTLTATSGADIGQQLSARLCLELNNATLSEKEAGSSHKESRRKTATASKSSAAEHRFVPHLMSFTS